MKKYDHKGIEKKWQDKWEKDKLYKTPDSVDGKENYYTLVEFPYPSGNLHVGHWYAFAVPDIFARFKRMKGFNVLYPIGFDSFGLPAENAAIKNKVDPKKWTYGNIDFMRNQLKTMGNSFDWSREIITSNPGYYKWNQWLFNKFYKNNLVYKGKRIVNWDPVDQTVLADEQVLADGTAERSGAKVEKKDLEQWMFKITDYAERLIDDLEKVDYPKEIKQAQKNWIGRSEGAYITFKVKGTNEEIKVFTTRPDTLYGATYVVLGPEHYLINTLKIDNIDEVKEYREKAKAKSEIDRTAEGREKSGVELIGIKAVNPVNNEEIPVFVADYVLGNYGTGAIMAVPAHDKRDFDFAKKYNLPIKVVLKHENEYRDIDQDKQISFLRNLYALESEHDGTMVIVGGIAKSALAKKADSFSHSDIDMFVTRELMSIVEDYLLNNGFSEEKEEYLASYNWKNKKAFSLKVDKSIWVDLFLLENSEGNYFDTITGNKFLWTNHGKIIDVDFCGIDVKIPDEALLEKIYQNMASTVKYCGDDTGIGILTNSGEFDGLRSEDAKKKIVEFAKGEFTTTYKLRDWIISRQRYWGTPIPIVYDPEGNSHPIPDEHLPWLLPTDVDYQPKGTSPLGSSKELLERTENIFGKGWKPETDTMDTFMDSSWYYLRYLDSKNDNEFSSMEKQKAWMPIDLYSGGSEHTNMHVLYSRFFYKALYDFGIVTEDEPYKRRMNRGLIMAEDGRKMSKRWGNVIDPDELVENIGADTVKMYLAFIGPYAEVGSYPWDKGGVVGIRRFLERIWNIQHRLGDNSNVKIDKLLHKTIKKVGDDIESLKFNTAISQIMILMNILEKEESVPKGLYEKLLIILAPFAPHMTEEIWHELENRDSIHLQEWPVYDENKVVEDVYTIPVQVNGKVRGTAEIAANSTEKDVLEIALTDENVKKWIGEGSIKKTIYVENRVINLLVDSI